MFARVSTVLKSYSPRVHGMGYNVEGQMGYHVKTDVFGRDFYATEADLQRAEPVVRCFRWLRRVEASQRNLLLTDPQWSQKQRRLERSRRRAERELGVALARMQELCSDLGSIAEVLMAYHLTYEAYQHTMRYRAARTARERRSTRRALAAYEQSLAAATPTPSTPAPPSPPTLPTHIVPSAEADETAA